MGNSTLLRQPSPATEETRAARFVSRRCDRCGQTILDGGSVLNVAGGQGNEKAAAGNTFGSESKVM